jgi:hypothetical protein
MNPRFSVGYTTKPGSIKFMILIVFVAVCLTGWMAIAKLQASEDNMDNSDASFQNAAQAQHAHNLAVQAALEDPEVAEAIELAKESKDPQESKDAKALFHEKMDDFVDEISDMRASGMGWGNIAKQLDVHPSFLGRGHSKFMAKNNSYFTKHARMRSEIKTATARSFKGQANKGHVAGGSTSQYKNLALTPAKGRGLALGHSKSKGGSVTVGQTTGRGNGHGVGHAAGNGRGNGGGNGNGNGNGGGKN